MPDEMVFGIRITGNSSGVAKAVASAISQFNKLDARIKTVAKAAGSQNLFGSSKNQMLSDSTNASVVKDISKWQAAEDIRLARQRIQAAKQQYDVAKKAASDYYAKIQAQEKKIADLRQQRAQAAAGGRGTARLDNSIGKQEQVLFDMQVKYAKDYGAKAEAAEKKLHDATTNYARKITAAKKKELVEQERAAKQSADNQMRQQQRMASQANNLAGKMRSGFQAGISNSISALGATFNSFRLLSQGATEFARVITTYIAIPLAGFFTLSTKTAMDFESSMVRVSKTTGMEGEELQKLTNFIRDFSKTTLSSQTELATFGEQLGQLNVTDTNAMSRLIATVEMMAAATDLSADQVTKSMGRIATAFGYDLNTETGVRAIEKLSNTINALENKTAATAEEVIEGLLNVASVGGMLDIPVQDMAAVTAMMESMGVASDAVGNRLTRFFQQLIVKSDEASKFMKGFTTEVVKDGETIKRTYSGDADQFMAFLNEDKTQVLTDFMTAMSQVPDAAKTQAMAQWFEMVGQVGGKVGVLAGNVTGLGNALKLAREEFESGNSLFQEYDKALMTTESHMKILRNNINDAAITVGDAFLPVLNRIVEYAVPGIQMLTAAFKSLSWETKVLVVGLPIIAMILAPLLFIFAQLSHAIGMALMGFQTLFVLAKNVGFAILGFGKAIGAAIGMLKLLSAGGAISASVLGGGLAPVLATLVAGLAGIAAAGGIAYAALKALQARGVDIAGFFHGLAARAQAWGENMMRTFAGGLLGGAAKFVTQAISRIAEWIAGFFEAHSPPKEGPLANIDKWGGPLFTSFLRGFYLADFSILSDVGNTVRNILQKMFSSEDSESAVAGLVAGARKALAELIDLFNKTGNISQGLLNKISEGTGFLAGDLQKLVTLWLKYEKTQRRIKELEESRQKVEKGYGDEVAAIAASNLSAEEKAARIRAAIAKKNAGLSGIDKEKAAEEEKAAALKEQLDWQKAFIDAQLEQADIFEKLADKIDKLGGALADLGESLDFGGAGGGKGNDPVKPFEELETTIKQRLASAKEVVKSFFAGLKGEILPIKLFENMGFPPELIAEMQKGYDLGKKFYDFFHPKQGAGGGDGKQIPLFAGIEATIKGISRAVSEAWTVVSDTLSNNEDVKTALKTIGDLITSLFSPKTSEELAGATKGWEQFGYGFGLVIGLMIKIVGALLIAVAWLFNLPKHLEEVGKFFADLGPKISAGLTSALESLRTFFTVNVSKAISEFFGDIAKDAGQWGADLFKAYGEGMTTSVGTTVGAAISKAAQAIADFFEPHSPPKTGPLSTIDTWGGKLLDLLLSGFLNGDFNPLAKIAGKLQEAISGIFGGGKDKESGGLAVSLVSTIIGIFDDIIGVFTEKIPALAGLWQQIKDQPQSILGDLGAAVILPIFMAVLAVVDGWFGTYTPLILQQWVLFRDAFVVAFEALPGMVALTFTSLFFKPEVVEAMKLAYDEFETAGKNFASAVGSGINAVTSDVVGAMSTLIDKLVLQIDRALAEVDALIKAFDELNGVSLPTAGGSSGGSGNGNKGSSSGKTTGKSATALGSGGVAIRPTVALIAEAGESEAVIPLSKLPSLVSGMMPTPEQNYINIEINNPTVRSDEDLRTMLHEVKKSIVDELRNQNRMRGR